MSHGPRVAPFPELADEQARMAFARACRDAMIDRLERVDPTSSADHITAEYVEMTVWKHSTRSGHPEPASSSGERPVRRGGSCRR
jgi:hypothetical protein